MVAKHGSLKKMINRTYSTYNYPSLEKKFKAPKSTQKISFYGNIGELPIYLFFFFFNWDSLHARLNSHYETQSYKKNKHKKIRAHNKSV